MQFMQEDIFKCYTPLETKRKKRHKNCTIELDTHSSGDDVSTLGILLNICLNVCLDLILVACCTVVPLSRL